MLFHASAEKSEPTCATQKATKSPNAPLVATTGETKEKSGVIGAAFCGVQKSLKFALTAPAL
jgi:hypothetical protein